MKLKPEIIQFLSTRIVEHLTENKDIEYDCSSYDIIEIVDGAIKGDLMIEDQLNDEVKAILAEQEDQIDENNINYRKVFQMIKNKLARERGLIL
ncbi:MAG: DUF507 family protein [Nitrospinota bacterium]